MKIIRRFSGKFSPLNMLDPHAPWQYSWYSMMGENQSKGYKAKWFGKFIEKHPGGDKEKVSVLYDLMRSAWSGGVILPLALIHTAFKVYHNYIAGENRKDGKPGRIMKTLRGEGGFGSMLMIIITPIYYIASVLIFGILGLLACGPKELIDLLINKERHFMKWPFGWTGPPHLVARVHNQFFYKITILLSISNNSKYCNMYSYIYRIFNMDNRPIFR